MQLRIICLTLFAFVSVQAACGEEPIEQLSRWLKKDPAKRPGISQAPFYRTSLTKAQAEAATKLLLADFQTRLKRERAQEWKKKVIQLGELSMKFEYKVFGEKPKSGRRLFISMHGGGGAPAELNDRQWRNQIRLYQPQEGVYLAPRAPTNTWNLWHQSHIDRFFERIIEDAILFADVDPNKVYIMGYSAGGDGVYQLAPRMADTLAAAAMMAGHPNDASALGLRNIGFTLHMGGKDSAYSRNKVARQWQEKLEKLQKDDPKGYRHKVVIHEQYGHWMNFEDRVAVPWMSKFTRDPNPKKVVWKQSSTTHDRFYWLAVDDENRKAGSLVVADCQMQKITISKLDGIDRVNIRLNDDLVDLDQAVEVVYPDGSHKTFEPQREIKTIFRCLSERVDPAAIYSAEIQIKSKP